MPIQDLWRIIWNSFQNLTKSVVRLFFDILHGIDRADIPLIMALEFAILLGYDGQLKQNSDLERELFQSTIDQLTRTKMTKVENALMWLFVKTWGQQGQHVIVNDEIWNFGGEDLQEAIMGIAYPFKREENSNEDGENLVESLRKLIMGRFDNKKSEFYEWSQTVHDEVVSTINWLYINKLIKGDENYSNESRNKNDGIYRYNYNFEW